MKHKLGTACMILGTALILAALSLFLWNRLQDEAAGASAQALLPRIVERVQTPDQPDPYSTAMTAVEIDGYEYIGYLSIPALELELPVQSEWDEARLRFAPCRYAGSTKTDDLVICAHNYTRHFGPIKDLLPGDAVYFTDMDGWVWQYEVTAVEMLAPADVDAMTAGADALTLFTCNYSGQSRVAVRCARITQE